MLPFLPGFLQPRALLHRDSRFVCTDVPAATGSLGMKAHLQWSKGQDRRLHLPLDKQVSGLFGILVCWAEETLLNYGCFIGCRLRERKGVSHTAMMLTPGTKDFY